MSPTERRRAWAYALICRASSPPPTYGSPEWLALPDGPEKVAAVVIAAEVRAREGDVLAELLRAEVAALQAAYKAGQDDAYVARRDDHRQSWTGSGFRPDPVIQDDIDREWQEWAGGAA